MQCVQQPMTERLMSTRSSAYSSRGTAYPPSSGTSQVVFQSVNEDTKKHWAQWTHLLHPWSHLKSLLRPLAILTAAVFSVQGL